MGGPGSWLCSEEGVGVLGSPDEGVGEAGGSSESEFSSEKSSTRALRPRMDSGRGARLQESYAVKLTHVSAPHLTRKTTQPTMQCSRQEGIQEYLEMVKIYSLTV